MGDQPNERGAVVNPLLGRSPSRPRVKRDISFILQKTREGKVREATLIDDEQRISVSTIDGQKWYAHYGPPGLSQEALMEELIRADALGNLKVTVEVSVWGMRPDSTGLTAQV
ncbi:hypothetical protein [Nonomuraea sp. NPDC049028]|uniref:hypothetical protein n=1 Tax=Nonomuraea sp. NPDC049028 TaxID=3364348 RepID=UPI00371F6F5A